MPAALLLAVGSSCLAGLSRIEPEGDPNPPRCCLDGDLKSQERSERPVLHRTWMNPGNPAGRLQEEFEIRCRKLRAWEEGNQEILYLQGDVEVRAAGMRLRADRVIVWRRKLGPRPSGFDELYAEGHVEYERDRIRIEAKGLYLDRITDRALIVEFVMRGWSRRLQTPIIYRAEEARRLAADRYVLDCGSVTSCTFGTPHYAVRIARAELTLEQPAGKAPLPRGWEPFPRGGDLYVAAEDISFWYGGLPFFYFPGLVHRLGDRFILRSFRGGRSSRFGTFVNTEWGFTLESGRGPDRTPWGEIILEADYRRERGYAAGLDVEWNLPLAKGYLDTYVLHDLGRASTVGFESKFSPLTDPDRWRARIFHRQALSPSLRLEIEASFLSDADLLEEFFPAEFKGGKEQETVAYLRGLEGQNGWFVLTRHRLNDFQTQTEWLPRMELWLLSEPVGDSGLQYSTRTRFVRPRLRFDEATGLRPLQSDILETLQELSFPLDAGPVQFHPYVSGRWTLWGDGAAGRSVTRSLVTLGLGIRSTLWRVFDVHAFGLDGLRHILEPEIRYVNAVWSSLDPAELLGVDPTDALDEFEEVALVLRQRFQTRTEEGFREFLQISFRAEYYPDSRRDTTALQASSFHYPFDPIAIFPLPGGSFVRRQWSNIYWRLMFDPGGGWTFRGEGEYDPVEHEEAARELGLHGPLGNVGSVGIAQTFVKRGADFVSLSTNLHLTKKWAVSAWIRRDLRGNRTTDQRLTLSRDLHDAWLRVSVERDRGRDDLRVFFRIEPGLQATRR